MERTIICATIDFLEEYKETLNHTGGYTKTDDQLKETIAYWKNEANRAEMRVIPPKNYLVKSGAAYLLKQKGWHTDNIAGKEGWIGQFAFEFGKEGEPEHHIALNFNDGTQIGFPPEAIEAV